jgi:hypothetical protein
LDIGKYSQWDKTAKSRFLHTTGTLSAIGFELVDKIRNKRYKNTTEENYGGKCITF